MKKFNNANKTFLAAYDSYENIYKNINMKKIYLPIPWGVKKSVKWLNKILLLENKQPVKFFEFEKTKESLGFICDEKELENLKNKDGLNIFQMCRDLGFELEIRSIGKTKYRRFIKKEHDNYEDALKFMDSNCIYSDIVMDERLILKNKQQFSFFDFEKGIKGAERTRERILMKCKRKGLGINNLDFTFFSSGVVSNGQT